MKKILFILFLLNSMFAFSTDYAEYVPFNHSKDADNVHTSKFIKFAPHQIYQIQIAFQCTINEKDTTLSLVVIEQNTDDYYTYPDDGHILVKLANGEVLKLNREPIKVRKNFHIGDGLIRTNYTECIYHLEPGMIDKIIANGFTKIRIEHTNNELRDMQGKFRKPEKEAKYMESQKADLASMKSQIMKTVEAGF